MICLNVMFRDVFARLLGSDKPAFCVSCPSHLTLTFVRSARDYLSPHGHSLSSTC